MLLGLIKESKRYLFVGFLSLILAVTFMFDIKREYGAVNITNLALGLLVFFGIFTLMLPHLKHSKLTTKLVIFLEIIASQYVAVTYFLIPAFDKSIVLLDGKASDWIALMLMIHALIHLFILYISKENRNITIFMIYLVLLMASVFIYNKDFLDVRHNYFLSVGFFGHTVLSIYYLVFDSKQKNKRDKNDMELNSSKKEVWHD